VATSHAVQMHLPIHTTTYGNTIRTSIRGHNGLRSLIVHGGADFLRLRCGVGRPNDPKNVGNFDTSKFQETQTEVDELISNAAKIILDIIK